MVRKITTVLLLAIVLMSCGGNGNKKEITCDSSNAGYQLGYKIGQTAIWNTPEEYIRECNNGTGMIGEVPECWKEGFRAAKQ